MRASRRCGRPMSIRRASRSARLAAGHACNEPAVTRFRPMSSIWTCWRQLPAAVCGRNWQRSACRIDCRCGRHARPVVVSVLMITAKLCGASEARMSNLRRNARARMNKGAKHGEFHRDHGNGLIRPGHSAHLFRGVHCPSCGARRTACRCVAPAGRGRDRVRRLGLHSVCLHGSDRRFAECRQLSRGPRLHRTGLHFRHHGGGRQPPHHRAGAPRRLCTCRVLPFSTSLSRFFVIMTLVPLSGSFITEPAAMTLAALLLRDTYFGHPGKEGYKYLIVGVLFVNVSIGGVLTAYAAPPVLMVAHAFGWDTAFMAMHFGWRAVLAVLVNSIALTFICRPFLQEIDTASVDAQSEGETAVPVTVTFVHL